jgi:tetratricopeptide (TPR) repeat protein
MDQQKIFDLYVYVVVTVIAQSFLAWELGTKGWSVATTRISGKVKLAYVLFLGQLAWQHFAKLEYPIKTLRDGWPGLISLLVFLVAWLRPWFLASRIPRLENFRRAKDLYQRYFLKLGIPFEHLREEQYRQATADPTLAEAERLYLEAIRLSAAEGEAFDVAVAEYQLAMLLSLQGKKDAASRLLNKALNTLSSYMSYEEGTKTAAGCHYHIGLIKEVEGDRPQARLHFKTAYNLEESIGLHADKWASKAAFERCGGSA